MLLERFRWQVARLLAVIRSASSLVLTPDPSKPVPLNWHEGFILHLASILRPRVYVELGLYECTLFNTIIPYADYLIGVDHDPNAAKHMRMSPKVRFLCAKTVEFSQSLARENLEIDMLFIDADHSRDAVLTDFNLYLPYVSSHGVILIHDTHPADICETDPRLSDNAFEAIPILQEEADGYEMVTIPVSPGLTICRKRTNQLSWHE